MNIEVKQTHGDMGSVSQADFESFNTAALMSSTGSIIFNWANGKSDTLDGPVALYLLELRLWADRILSSEKEECLELYMTPFLYGTRSGNVVTLSYFSNKIESEHDIQLIELTDVDNISRCISDVNNIIAEYPPL